MEDAGNKFLPKIGWVLILLGWQISAVFANGGEVWKMSVVVPFIVLGVFLCLFGSFGISKLASVVVLLVSAFFIGRGLLSPVKALARYDLLLVLLGGLTVFGSAAVLNSKWALTSLVLFSVFGVLLQVGAASWQFFGDSSWVFLRGSHSQESVSGFFFLRNYLAGYLQIVLPLLVGWILSRKRFSLAVLSLLVVVLLGVLTLILTHVRGGFVSLGVSLLCLFMLYSRFGGVETLGRRLFQGRLGYFRLGFFASVALTIYWTAFVWIIDVRGGKERAEVNLENRLELAGVAFSIWEKYPWLGIGSHGFSYYFPMFVGDVRKGFGDAVRVHNEYLQILSDYGAIGLVLVCGLILWLLLKAHRKIIEVNDDQNFRKWIVLVFVSVLVGECIRASIDFNLHALSNFLGLAILAGAVLVEPEGRKSPLFVRFAVCLFAILTLRMSIGDLSSLEERFRIVHARLAGQPSEVREIYAKIHQESPDFAVSREAARFSMAVYLKEPTLDNLITVRGDLERCISLHPFDGETFANYGRILSESGEFERAEFAYERAIALVGKRERTYGVLYSYAGHLLRRGLSAWKERQPGFALGWFIEAKRVMEASSFRVDGFRAMREFLLEKIAFLEDARIETKAVGGFDWEQTYEMAQNGSYEELKRILEREGDSQVPKR